MILQWLRMFRFGVGDYAFFLLLISAGCFLLERLFAWRKDQPALRPGFLQDLGWLTLNGHVLGVLLWKGKAWLWAATGLAPLWAQVESVRLLGEAPWWAQLLVLLVLKDFLDWCVHNLLHRVPALWEFHKVHHSIEALDWVGNFRFHWVEILVYGALTYLPLAVLGFSGQAWLGMAIIATAVGHLNHSNLDIGWGPLRYVLNSPRMHVWHHDYELRGKAGVNFAIVFSAWDWLFGTAQLPQGQPARLGFAGIERFPKTWLARFTWPLWRLWGRAEAPPRIFGAS